MSRIRVRVRVRVRGRVRVRVRGRVRVRVGVMVRVIVRAVSRVSEVFAVVTCVLGHGYRFDWDGVIRAIVSEETAAEPLL
jgi:hypothetical protein